MSAPTIAKAFCRVLLAALIGVFATGVAEAACTNEQEPNNGPLEAPAVTAPFCLKGRMPGNDQDMVAWTLNQKASAHPWQLTLSGIPGAITRLDIFTISFTDDGNGVSDYSSIYSLTSKGNGSPIGGIVILRPGKYFLGLSHAGGGGAYRLNIAPVSAGAQPEVEPNDTDKQAQALAAAFDIAGNLKGGGDRFRWTLSAADASQHWRLVLRLPLNSDGQIVLYDTKGNMLGERNLHDRNHGRIVFDNLGLAAGSYIIRIGPGQDTNTPYRFAAKPTGPRLKGQEDEPDDLAPNAARSMAGQQHWQGAIGPNDPADIYTLEVAQAWRLKREYITLRPMERGLAHHLSLRDAKGQLVASADGDGSLRLSDLALAPGKYQLRVSGDSGPYDVQLNARVPGFFDEGEPNGTDALARHMGLVARGRFEKSGDDDTDVWQFTTKGPAQFWAIHASGNNLKALTYHGGVWFDANNQPDGDNNNSLSLGPLLLGPGKHYIKIRGASGPYVLTRRALGPPRPSMEVEPNNSDETAQSLVFGQPVDGLLVNGDTDIYRFSLPMAMHLRLTLANRSDDGGFVAELHHVAAADDELAKRWLDPGDDFNWNGVLPAGDYTVNLHDPSRATAPNYRIALTRLDPFKLPRDREINDSTKSAAPLPPDRRLKGGFPFDADTADFYRLPVQPVPAKITVAPLKGAKRVDATLVDGQRVDRQGYDAKPLALQWSDKNQRYQGQIPANARTYLKLANKRYKMKVTLDPDPQGGPVKGTLPVTLKAALKLRRVAAFRPVAQRIRGQIQLKNTGSTAVQLTLKGRADAYVGHIGAQGWRITFEQPRLMLAAGTSQTVAFTVEISPDSYTDKRVPVTLAVQGPMGRVASATVGIAVDPLALPVAPHPWDALPAALLGGVDVSRPVFGAKILLAPGGNNDRVKKRAAWHDDMVDAYNESDRDVVGRPSPDKPLNLPVKLSALVPVTGLVLTPAFYVTQSLWPRDFELQLSVDGKTWVSVLKGRMSQASQPQAFVLPHVRRARFARLRLLNRYDDDSVDDGSFALGGWKVIARPGFDPTAGTGFNLAAPFAGGHLVWADPVLDGGANAVNLLSENPDIARADIQPAKGGKTGALAWVVGFHDDRAAQVSGFEWVRAAKSEEGHRLENLSVSVSTDSPLGPWHDVGVWSLGGRGPAIWRLKKPVWARFVRFSANDLPPGETVLAATLRIRERPASADYFSTLGEWGLYGPEAFFEHSVPAPRPKQLSSDNTSRNKALVLASAATIAGHVRINKRIEWYRVNVPNSDNELDITLKGNPSVDVRPVVLNASGKPVLLTCKNAGPQTRHCRARVAPGRHDLRIEEPRRSLLIAWDTSASMANYAPQIYRALRHYSLGLDPKTEALNFLPYGHGQLLEPTWLVHPLQAFSALHAYTGGDDSSNSYDALRIAAKGLSTRQGARAILVLTDAETDDYDSDARDMWRRFGKTPARIFSVLLPSAGLLPDPRGDRERMQDWAATDGGTMTYATAQWEIDAAFARTSAWLRRPKSYTLGYTTRNAAPPKPGRILVVAASGQATPKAGNSAVSGAVGLILDASGSMWRRIDGVARIVAARDALKRIVTDVIPTGTPVALRVFGDQAARSCKQALEAPLAPLTAARRQRLVRLIEAVNPKRRSKTPIAAALERMATDDLAQATGQRMILLVTDGHETCGGDPEATIRALEKQGIAVQLNIVGLAIADQALKRQFRLWAKLGGGAYFDATNVKALRRGVRDALSPPFQVLSASGKVVARGRIGGPPVTVAPGRYQIKTKPSQGRGLTITVLSGKEVKVAIPPPSAGQ